MLCETVSERIGISGVYTYADQTGLQIQGGSCRLPSQGLHSKKHSSHIAGIEVNICSQQQITEL